MAYADEVLADDPLGYWKLDETSGTSATDSSGNGNSGTHANAPLLNQATGVVGSTAAINYRPTAPAEYTNLGNLAAWQLSNGTLEAWIKMSSPGTSFRHIFGKENAYTMFLVGNEFGYYDWGGGTGHNDSNVSLNDNVWHHVVMTFQSGVTNGTKLYVDGSLVYTGSLTVLDQTKNLYIANSRTGSTDTQAINGLIDEVAIYGSVLSPTRIATHHAVGTGTTGHMASATVAGTGSITAEGTVTTPADEHEATASVAGTASISSTAVREAMGAVSLAGTSTVDAVGIREIFGSASIAGTTGITASGTRVRFATGQISGVGSVTAEAVVISEPEEHFGAASIAGVGGITSSARREKFAAATIPVLATFAAEGIVTVPGHYIADAVIAGTSVISAGGVYESLSADRAAYIRWLRNMDYLLRG